MTTKKADTPAPTTKVSFDLDALDREGRPEPFSIRHVGRVYTFADAMDVDWQKLMAAMQNPVAFFHLTLPEGDAKEFLSQEMSVFKMRRLMDAYREHYGVTDPGDQLALPR